MHTLLYQFFLHNFSHPVVIGKDSVKVCIGVLLDLHQEISQSIVEVDPALLTSLALLRRELEELLIWSTMRRKLLGRSDQTTPSRVLITKNGKAAHCRNDCSFLLKSYSNQSLSWCSHCDPSNVLGKRTWSGALGHENKF